MFERTEDGLGTCLFVAPFLPTIAVSSNEAAAHTIALALSGTSKCCFPLCLTDVQLRLYS